MCILYQSNLLCVCGILCKMMATTRVCTDTTTIESVVIRWVPLRSPRPLLLLVDMSLILAAIWLRFNRSFGTALRTLRNGILAEQR